MIMKNKTQKNSQKQNETADSTLTPKDIYTPDNTIVEPVEVEVINLTEKQAVKIIYEKILKK